MTGLAIVLAMTNPDFYAVYEANGWAGVELTANALSWDLGGDGKCFWGWAPEEEWFKKEMRK